MADLTVSMTYMKGLFDHENFPKVFFVLRKSCEWQALTDNLPSNSKLKAGQTSESKIEAGTQ